jgi:predicted nucleotidyltransferase
MAMKQEILDITEAIKQAVPVEAIYLFGSHANGAPTEDSDYDFYMVIPDGGLSPLEAMQKARKSLSAVNRQTAVDILADYHSRFNNRRYLNTLERKVANEGVVLYERN